MGEIRWTLLGLALLVTATAVSQSNQDQKYVGEWTAQLNGKVYARAEFRVEDGKLVGKVSTGDVSTDASGEVSKVNEEAGDAAPAFDIKVSETSLRFKRKDGDEVDSFEFKITGVDRAELALQMPPGAPEGAVAPRPFKMMKKHAS